jgi:Tol biopolymer transport system component
MFIVGSRVAALVLFVAACGFRAEVAHPPGDDDPSDAAVPGDGEDPDADISMLGPFGMPVQIGALADLALDDDPTVTADRCELYYSSTRNGNEDIYVSKRASPSAAWGAPVRVAELSSGSIDTTPEVSADGLTIYITRADNILRSTRPTRDAAWSAPASVDELNTASLEGSSAPTASHLTMVMASTRNTGNFDLWIATRASTALPWSGLAPIAELNTGLLDTTPFFAETHQFLIFASDRAGAPTKIFSAQRTGPSATFAAPQEIAELNTGATMDPWISEDLRYVVFASSRSGNYEIYEASR